MLKLKSKDELNNEYKKNNKLFNDYIKKEELINKLRQQYLYQEGEKYTFYPIINNYIFKFKYKQPYFINNNKISMTEPNKFFENKTYEKNNKSNNIFNQTRYNKNKKIKRIKILNGNINKVNYIKNNKGSTPNFIINNKTESSLYKLKERNMTLKSLIQEEKLKDKIINKKMNYNMNKQNVNKIINKIFNKTNLKRNKTQTSFITNDELSYLTNKTYNNNSTYENINLQIKKIDIKNNRANIIHKNKKINIDINKLSNESKNKKIIIYNKTLNNNLNNNKSPKKIIKIFPNNKLRINNIRQITNKQNSNNRYYNKINFNKTQMNNDETTLTSDYNELKGNKEIIYKNISFEIKKKKNELNNIKKEDDDISIQSLSDSKVLEIANTYIDERVDKSQIDGILTYKKLQNQNFSYEK